MTILLKKLFNHQGDKAKGQFFDEEKNLSSEYIVCGDYYENGSIEGASISGIKAYEQLKNENILRCFI